MHSFVLGISLLFLLPLALAEEKALEDQSVSELKQVITSDPTNLNAYYYLAQSYLGLRTAPRKNTGTSLNQTLEDSSEFYEDALARIADGDQRAAIIQLMNAIKVDETNLAAYVLLAETYEEVRIAEGAEYYLREALEQGADPGLILVPLGHALLSQENYEAVLSDLPLAGLSRNLKARVRVLHGKAFLGLQQYDKAERILKEAVRGDQSVTGAQIELARLQLIRGNRDDARKRLDLIQGSAEFLPDYWLIRGELARTSGANEDALALYRRAIKLDNEHLLVLHALASLNLDLGNLLDAGSYITEIRRLYPNNLRGMLLALTLATRQKDMKARQEIIQAADEEIASVDFIKLQDDPYNLILIGTIHFLSGRMNEAASLLGRFLELAPSDLGALRLLVTSQLSLGKPAAAISLLQQTSQYHENHALWLSLFSEALIQQKKYEQAITYLDRVIQQNPSDKKTRLRRVTLNATMGNHDIALQELDSLDEGGEDPSIGITKANILLALGRFDAALTLVNELINSHGKKATFHNIAGNAQLGLNNLKKARNSFNYALIDEPDSITATFNIASLDLKEGNLDLAKERFQKILEKNGSHVLSMIQLSGIAERQGNRQAATRYLNSAMLIRPDVKNSLRLVNLLNADERKQEARTVLSDLRMKYPEDLSVLAADAKWSSLNNNPDRAKQLYLIMQNQAIQNASVADLVNVARFQQAIGDQANAIKALAEARKIDKSNLFVLVTSAEFKVQEEKYEEALQLAEDIIRQAPEQAVGYRLKGDSLTLLGQENNALHAYQTGVLKTAGSVALILRYYTALKDIEGPKRAVKFLEDWVIEKRTGEFTILRALAAGHAELGNTAKAVALNEALLSNHPADVSLLNNLALLYLDTGDHRARSFAEKAYDLAPQNFAVMDTLGWVLTNEGDISLGIAMLRNALARSANIPEIRYHYAVALHKSGQSKVALKELRNILADGQAFSGVEEARALFQQLSKGA